jgi:hypothetical protein
MIDMADDDDADLWAMRRSGWSDNERFGNKHIHDSTRFMRSQR